MPTEENKQVLLIILNILSDTLDIDKNENFCFLFYTSNISPFVWVEREAFECFQHEALTLILKCSQAQLNVSWQTPGE